MSRRYTILRDLNALKTGFPFDGSAARGLETISTAQPVLEIEELRSDEVTDLVRDPQVSAVAPVMPTKLIAPIDMGDSEEPKTAWGIQAVGADTTPYTGKGVSVAVLDTGIDAGHKAFTGISLVEKDFTGDGNGDVQGHGTHCAGTFFGRNVDEIRIGVALGVEQAFIGKILGNDGRGDSTMLFEGIQWAVSMGAEVVSMSLGFDFPGWVKSMVNDQDYPVDFATSMALEGYRSNIRMFDAIMLMIKQRGAFGPGTVVVAASGNESKRNNNPDYTIGASIPAAADGVVAVGAVQQGDNGLETAWFSNIFPQLAAPGVAISSAQIGGGLKSMSGTSMACPHVAGLAALWWEAVRGQPLPEKATVVQNKLLSAAVTTALAATVDVADRGYGLAQAPK